VGLSPAQALKAPPQHLASSRARHRPSRSDGASTHLTLLGQAFAGARGWLAWPLPARPHSVREARAVEDGPAALADLLQGLFDTLHEEVALLDPLGMVIAVNGAWCATFPDHDGGALKGGLGISYLELCRGISPDLASDEFQRGVGEVIGRRAGAFTHEYVVPSDDRQRRRQARITPLASAGAALLVAIHEEAGPPRPVSSLADDLLTAQDEERQRIAMELHDSTSQHLVALGFGIARLRRILGAAADDVLEDMSSSISEVVKEIRILSFLKRPPGLQRNGFGAAVAGFVKGFGVRAGLEIRLTSEGDLDDAPPDVQHAAFRILQESLSNVYRHAAATLVEVELRRLAQTLVVRVSDNGRGIAGLRRGALSDVSLGVGIVGMQTRASQLGGSFAVSNGLLGAVVTVTLPCTCTLAADSRPKVA
jgi:signal transduction histidine kinase